MQTSNAYAGVSVENQGKAKTEPDYFLIRFLGLSGVFFNRTEAYSENLPLRGIALSVKLAYLRMKVGLLCVFCLLQWCIV